MPSLSSEQQQPPESDESFHPDESRRTEFYDSSSSSEEDEVTALHDFIAGGLAGTASVVVGHPFDTIKVRLQTSSAPTSLFVAASSFGGVSSLFRGMAAPLSSAAVVNALIFSSYAVSTRWYDQYLVNPQSTRSLDDDLDNNDHDPWKKSSICGGFAGFVQCFVICPMEHIKCRLQVQHGKGSADHLYKGPVQAGTSILRSHGISGLFRGWWSTCLREVPAFGIYFSTYDYVKDKVNALLAERAGIVDDDSLDGSPPTYHAHTWLASAFAGGMSGVATWAVVYPVDIVKTRIQTSSLDAPRSQISMLNMSRQIVKKHGWRFMFRGFGITVARAAPVNATIFPVYEFTLMQIKNFEGANNY